MPINCSLRQRWLIRTDHKILNGRPPSVAREQFSVFISKNALHASGDGRKYRKYGYTNKGTALVVLAGNYLCPK